jgi:hypothetical protein
MQQPHSDINPYASPTSEPLVNDGGRRSSVRLVFRAMLNGLLMDAGAGAISTGVVWFLSLLRYWLEVAGTERISFELALTGAVASAIIGVAAGMPTGIFHGASLALLVSFRPRWARAIVLLSAICAAAIGGGVGFLSARWLPGDRQWAWTLMATLPAIVIWSVSGALLGKRITGWTRTS